MCGVSRFLENALAICETVENSSGAGHDISELTILISPTGGIQMVAGCDWPLDALQGERGAQMVYRIRRRQDAIRVEGRAGLRTCLFEAAKPDGAARPLPAGRPEDLLRPPVLIPQELPAASARLLPAASD